MEVLLAWIDVEELGFSNLSSLKLLRIKALS